MTAGRLERERDRTASPDLLRKCFFCRKPRRAERLKRVSYQGDDNALPIDVSICVPCERETWTDE